MRYLYLSNNQVVGTFAGPQPGLKLDENEEIIEVEDNDPRVIEFDNREVL
ncbi:hypothetical protein [Leptospira johnsonii]|uniref:Uncharacterized protein n=1 Tax=Leptospira johnsonii TaxID=1917820 RepID=A0A2P2D7S8_9LEPT|nr:hypothetical protein [Leptospira johnsonii]GBF40687.1 hypothetical protein LPTSP1_37050 [Leptospira johnsonii]